MTSKYPPLGSLWALVLAVGWAGACIGSIEAGGTSGGDDVVNAGGGTSDRRAGGTAGGPDATGPSSSGAPGESAGPLPLRRLTRLEYNNTVRDLLGDTRGLANDFPEDAVGSSGFLSPGAVSAVEARNFVEAAEKLAAGAAQNIPGLVGCDTAKTGEDACARQFIGKFGRRAYRRPLDPSEVERLHGVYTIARREMQSPFADAIRVVLETMLQSPNFLYRWELGLQAPVREGALVKLGPHEVASRLSYFLWSSMPDEPLFAAADAGKLGTAAAVAQQARRMLADAKARDTVISFHTQWLHLEYLTGLQKDANAFPELTPALLQSMEDETRAFVSHVVLQGDGQLGTLLAATFSFVNDSLARLYGIGGVTGSALQRRDLDPQERWGLLTQGSFLAKHTQSRDTSPVKRGKVIREQVLCQEVPPPPDNADTKLPAADPTKSERARFVEHAVNPACSGCHGLMDPLGFAFDNYNALGGLRTKDGGGHPIDTTGVLKGLAGGERSFAGAGDLIRLLAGSDEVGRCAGNQWMRFALGRELMAADQGSMQAAYESFRRSGFDIRELLVTLAQTKTFLYRSPTPEVMP